MNILSAESMTVYQNKELFNDSSMKKTQLWFAQIFPHTCKYLRTWNSLFSIDGIIQDINKIRHMNALL